MKKLVAVLQKKVSREEMVNKLEEILIPLASILNDDMPVYHGFPVESIILEGNENAFIVGFNKETLAMVDLEKSEFSVFGSPKYELLAEEHAIISHIWEELKKRKDNKSDIERLLAIANYLKDNN
jgi:hypothetical protein